MGSAHRMSAPYQAIRCADGYITVAAANDRLFARLCSLLGHPEWATLPEYRDDTHRVKNRQALAASIESVTQTAPRAHWLARFEEGDLPCGPINDYAQVFGDPQVQARAMVLETDHPTLGRVRTLGAPVKMSATPPRAGRRAPLLGEHTEEVLREAGCERAVIEQILGSRKS
jgi:formyl-CoA transferase